MSKFKESLKEEIKEEVGDLIYEKAKTEIKEEISERYQSTLDRVLGVFGIRRKRKEAIEKASQEIKQKEELLMSQSALGIVELFTINFGRTALEISSTFVGENKKTLEIPDLKLKEKEGSPSPGIEEEEK